MTYVTLPSGSALRSDPSQYKTVAEDLDNRRQAVNLKIAELRGSGVTYGLQQAGPDSEVIAAGIAQVADAYQSRIANYTFLANEFSAAFRVLTRLETRSTALDTERSRILDADTDPEADLTRDAADFDREFQAIRSEERTALVLLATAIGETSFGDDISYDSAAWSEVIDRSMPHIKDPRVQEQLQASLVTIADHAEDGDLDGIDEETTDKVTEARINGQTSAEAGLPAALFPPNYDENVLRLRELEHDDHPNVPWWGNPSDEEKAEAAKIREKLGLDDDPEVTRVQIVSDTAELHGAQEWKGEQLAELWEENVKTNNPIGGPHGGFKPETELSEEAQLALGEALADDERASSSFFNQLGPGATATIPTLIDEKPKILENFSESLAAASRDRTENGGKVLNFDGDEVIAAPVPFNDSISPALLFVEGDFDEEFLAAATSESVRQRGGETARPSIQTDLTNDGAFTEKYGSNATNILLDQANENPETVNAVISELEKTDSLDLLLNPDHPHTPFNGAGSKDEPRFPIAEFLGIAGANERNAGLILSEANTVDEFSDPGVAGGIDAIMARHATVMYEKGYLEGLGIEPGSRLDQSEFGELGLDNDDWKAMRAKVLEHGMGERLAEGNNQLIAEAIEHDISEGTFGDNQERYKHLAIQSGVLDEQWFQSALEVKQQADADGEANNARLAATISTGVSVATLPLGPGTGLAIGTGTNAVLSEFPVSIWETGTTEEFLIKQHTADRGYDALWKEMVIAPTIQQAAESENPITTTNSDGQRLELSISNKGDIISTNTETGEITIDPDVNWHTEGKVGRPRGATEGLVDRHFVAGQNKVDPRTEDVDDDDYVAEIDEVADSEVSEWIDVS